MSQVPQKPVEEMTEGEFRLFVVWNFQEATKRLDGIYTIGKWTAATLFAAGLGFFLNVILGAIQ